MAKKKTNKTKVTPATKKESKPVVKNEDKKEVAKKPVTNDKTKVAAKPPVNKKKRTALKATLITLAAVVGAAGLGFGGYYLWNHFEISPAQPAVDKDIQAIIYMMNALNENSTKADFDEIDQAYKALTVKQQERLDKTEAHWWYSYQGALYKIDSDNVNEFFNITKGLVPETCSTVAISKARKLAEDVKSINRGQDFQEKINEAQKYLAAAEAKYKGDEQLVNTFVNTVNAKDFVNGSTTENLDEAKDLMEKAKLANQSRLDETFEKMINDGEKKLLEAQASHNTDDATVKSFEEAASKLKQEEDTCSINDINTAKNLEKKIIDSIDIKRRESDFKKRIEDASAIIVGVSKKYATESEAVNAFAKEIDDLVPASCTNAQLEAADESATKIASITRSDFAKIIADAKAKLAEAHGKYNADKAKVESFKDAAVALDPATCIKSKLDELDALAQEASAINTKRSNDFDDYIAAGNEKLKGAHDAYDTDAGKVNAFVSAANSLNSETCTVTQLEEVKALGDTADTVTREEPKFAEDIAAAKAALAAARAAYDVDAAKIAAYKDAATALVPASCNSGELAAVDALAEEANTINTKRSNDFEEDITAADTALALAQGSYDSDADKINDFVTEVNDLDVNTCTKNALDNADQTKAVVEMITRNDETLKAKIDAAKAALAAAHAAYDADAAKVKEFKDAATALVPASCNSGELADVDALAEEVASINRGDDFVGDIAAADAALAAAHGSYDSDADKINDFVTEVNDLDVNTCTKNALDNADQTKAVVEMITRNDETLKAKIDAAKAALAAAHAVYDVDAAKIAAYKGAATALVPASCNSGELAAVDALAEEANTINTKRSNDFDDDITVANAALAAAHGAYNDDVTAAKEITDAIDNIYSDGTTEITQQDITDISTAYSNLSTTRAKSMADATCTDAHGENVQKTVQTIQAQYDIGDELNDIIDTLDSDIDTYDTNAKKFHLVSTIDRYNICSALAKKAVTAENKSKIKKLDIGEEGGKPGISTQLQTAYKSVLSGDIEGVPTYSFDSEYGNLASVTISKPSAENYSNFMVISAEQIASLKEKFTELHFSISIGEDYDGQAIKAFEIVNGTNTVYQHKNLTQTIYYEVTINLSNIDSENTLVFRTSGTDDDSALKCKITNLYGVPKA